MILTLKIIAIWFLLNALIAVLMIPPRIRPRSNCNDKFEKEGSPAALDRAALSVFSSWLRLH